jgi:phosphate-selective porin
MVYGYADGGDAPAKQLSLIPGAVKEAQKLLEQEDATKKNFDRVSTLVGGFESPFGMELLATVHWVAKQESANTLRSIVQKTHEWSERKKRFTPRQIELAAKALSKHGWIELHNEAA